MDIRDLDWALRFLYNNENHTGYLDVEIFKGYPHELHPIRQVGCLRKLVKDGYVDSHKGGITRNGVLIAEHGTEAFYINYDGYQFYKRGGYQQMEKDIQTERGRKERDLRDRKTHAIILSVGSVLAGIGTLGLLAYNLGFFDGFSCCCCG